MFHGEGLYAASCSKHVEAGIFLKLTKANQPTSTNLHLPPQFQIPQITPLQRCAWHTAPKWQLGDTHLWCQKEFCQSVSTKARIWNHLEKEHISPPGPLPCPWTAGACYVHATNMLPLLPRNLLIPFGSTMLHMCSIVLGFLTPLSWMLSWSLHTHCIKYSATSGVSSRANSGRKKLNPQWNTCTNYHKPGTLNRDALRTVKHTFSTHSNLFSLQK